MERFQKLFFVLYFLLLYLVIVSPVSAMNLAPKGSILLDRVMYDYIIPGMVVGLFAFIFVIFAVFGRDASDAWRSLCVFYIGLFIYLLINFSFWWILKQFDVPKRELFSVTVFIVTGSLLTLTLFWHMWMKRPRENISKTWVCPHCGKENTFTLSCWECSRPRVITKRK